MATDRMGLCVLALFLIIFIGAQGLQLTPGALNVLTKYETYYTPEKVMTKQLAYRQTCTQTCDFWVFCKTKCNTVSYHRWVEKTIYVKKTRPVYACKPGWAQAGNSCPTPICTSGCLNNGTCTAPERCNCSAGWSDLRCETDINECNSTSGFNHSCQERCVNVPGSYQCACSAGHFLASNGRDCTDHDECAHNIHGCAQGCINYPGGYNCTCHSGYTLNTTDYKSCGDIDECRLNIAGCSQSCGNYIGGYSCRCNPGYYLKNDLKSCSRIYCPTPVAPQNGFIYSPCDTEFDSRCTIGCTRGYYLATAGTVTCVGTGVWEPRNLTCEVIGACDPNPCQHGGKCSSISTSHYTCQCFGYEGDNCELSIITLPPFPVLTTNIPSPPLMFTFSPPSHQVILTPNSNDLIFEPANLVVNASTCQQNVTVRAQYPGVYTVGYTISGYDSVDFTPPESGVVIGNNPNSSITGNGDFGLPVGCYNLAVGTCPKGSDAIVMSSTSSWDAFGPTASTSGPVMVNIGESALPLSVTGASFSSNAKPSIKEGCTPNSDYSVEGLVTTRALSRSFLAGIRASFPPWLNLEILLRNSSSSTQFSKDDLKASFLTGKKLRQLDVGLGQPVNDEASFLLLFSQNANLSVEGNTNILEPSNHRAPIAVAVDLCSTAPRNIYLRPSREHTKLVNGISVFKRLISNGWDMSIFSMQISKTRSIKKLKKGVYWNGDSFTHVAGGASASKADLALVASIKKSFTNKDVAVNCFMDFDGTLLMDVEHMDKILQSPLSQRWSTDLYGTVKLIIQFKLEGKTANLALNAPESTSYASFGGSSRERRAAESNNKLLEYYFKYSASNSPFLDSKLNDFVELGANKTIALFLGTELQSNQNTNQSQNLDLVKTLSIAFQGDLKFSQLRFPALFIKMNIVARNVHEVDIEFQGSTRETLPNTQTKRGIFLMTSPNPRVHFSREHRNQSWGTFDSRVKLFGFEKAVNVRFSQKDGLRFNTSGKLHGVYDATITCQSNLVTWEDQKFVARGEFVGATTSAQPGLVGDLNQALYDYATRVVSRGLKRVASAKERRERSGNEHLEALLVEKQTEKDQAFEDFKIAERKLNASKLWLSVVEGNVSARLDMLKLRLRSLCEMKHCPRNVCREGVICQPCDHVIAGKSKETCLRNCTKLEKRIIEDKTTTKLCRGFECERVYSDSGLSRERLREIYREMKQRIYSHGKKSSGIIPPSGDPDLTPFSRGNRKGEVCMPGTSSHNTPFCENDDRDGHWECGSRLRSCAMSVYSVESFRKKYACEKSCEEHISREMIPKSCCALHACAFRVVDLSCVAESTLCAQIRSDALEKVLVPNSSVSVLKTLQNAKAKVSYWEITKQKAFLRLASATNSLNATLAALNSLKKAQNASIEGHKNVSTILTQSLKLKGYLNDEDKSQNLVKFNKIAFNVEIGSANEKTLPVRVRYAINGKEDILDSVLDFGKLSESISNIAKEILDTYIQKNVESTARKRRSITENNPEYSQSLSSLRKYHKLCSEHINFELALHDIVQSLYNLTSEAKQLLNDINDRSPSGTQINSSQVFENLNLNLSALAGFGLTNISKREHINKLQTDSVFLAGKDLENEVSEDGYKPLYSTSKLMFRNWYSAMENIFSVVSTKCSGFEDCILYIVDGLGEMYASLDHPVAEKGRIYIKELERRLLNLTQSSNMNVNDAYDASRAIVEVLRSFAEGNPFCSDMPNITHSPAPLTELGLGQTLILNCNATGDNLVYQWRLDNDLLPNMESNVLTIENVTQAHAGKYTCHVSNYVAMETSTPALVVLHSPPTITIQPVSRLNVVISFNNSLRCEAQSSDSVTNITYEWWFKSSSQKSFGALSGETYPRLNIAPMTFSREGWYYCVASNRFGRTISKTTLVTALRFSLPVSVVSLSFTLTRKPGQNTPYLQNQQEHFSNIKSKVRLMLVSNALNTSLPDLKDLQLTDCQLQKSTKDRTQNVAEFCQWSFNYVAENVTKNSSMYEKFLQNAQSVVDSTASMDRSLKSLIDKGNGGSLAFVFRNESYEVQGSSFVVQDFALVCSPGQKMIQRDYMCVDCSPGSYGADDGNMRASCLPCVIGSYQPGSGQASCTACPEGFTTQDRGSYDKKQCKVICPAGHYGVIHGGVGSCLQCPDNTYQPESGQFHCVSCPAGKITTTEGADDISKCVTVPTSKPATRTTEEIPLTEGTYGPSIDALKRSSDEKSNHGALIGGVVGGGVILAIVALLILLLVKRRRNNAARKDSFDGKDVVVPQSTFELADCRENPAFIDDSEFVGAEGIPNATENPTYQLGWACHPPPENAGTENPAYETSGDNPAGDVTKPYESGWEAHPPIENAGTENPMYETSGYLGNDDDDVTQSYEGRPSEVDGKGFSSSEMTDTDNDNDNGSPRHFGNPLYESFRDETPAKKKDLTLTLSDEQIDDEEV